MPRASSAAERRAAANSEPDQAMSHLLIRMANDVARLRQEVERNRQEIRALSNVTGAVSKPTAPATAAAEEPAALERLFDAAGFTGYMAILLFAFAFAFLLDLVVPAWIAFLIVGLLFAGGAYALYRRGEDRIGSADITTATAAAPAATPSAATEPISPE